MYVHLTYTVFLLCSCTYFATTGSGLSRYCRLRLVAFNFVIGMDRSYTYSVQQIEETITAVQEAVVSAPL